MPSVASVMAQLKSKGKESTRKIYARHGMREDLVLGVSVADLKVIAKSIKGQQELACSLYATGIMDAMYLAGMVANGVQMTKAQLTEWAEGAEGLQMISEYTVPWVAVDSRDGRDLALQWMKAKKEHIAASGWCTYAGLVTVKPNQDLDLAEVEGLLRTVVKSISNAPNRVRHAMNGFIISVGCYVKPLHEQALKAAHQVGTVTVDVGDTACKIPLAVTSIEKVEAAGKLGQKRKTIRC
jgi:3-methyladenine DNA glycosylase AlkD